jgi:hypothetical protein
VCQRWIAQWIVFDFANISAIFEADEMPNAARVLFAYKRTTYDDQGQEFTDKW